MTEKQPNSFGRFESWSKYSGLELGIFAALLVSSLLLVPIQGVETAREAFEMAMLSMGCFYIIGHIERLPEYVTDDDRAQSTATNWWVYILLIGGIVSLIVVWEMLQQTGVLPV